MYVHNRISNVIIESLSFRFRMVFATTSLGYTGQAYRNEVTLQAVDVLPRLTLGGSTPRRLTQWIYSGLNEGIGSLVGSGPRQFS